MLFVALVKVNYQFAWDCMLKAGRFRLAGGQPPVREGRGSAHQAEGGGFGAVNIHPACFAPAEFHFADRRYAYMNAPQGAAMAIDVRKYGVKQDLVSCDASGAVAIHGQQGRPPFPSPTWASSTIPVTTPFAVISQTPLFKSAEFTCHT